MATYAKLRGSLISRLQASFSKVSLGFDGKISKRAPLLSALLKLPVPSTAAQGLPQVHPQVACRRLGLAALPAHKAP